MCSPLSSIELYYDYHDDIRFLVKTKDQIVNADAHTISDQLNYAESGSLLYVVVKVISARPSRVYV